MDTSTHSDHTQGHPPEEHHTMAPRSDTDDRNTAPDGAVNRSGRRGLIWAVAVLAVLVIAGVSFVLLRGGGGDPAPTPTTAATIDDAARQAAIDESWASTQRYGELSDQAFQAASVDGIDLQSVAWPAVVDDITRFAESLKRQGQHQTGVNSQTLISSDFAPSSDPANAGDVAYGTVTLQVCVDASGSDLVDDTTGESVQVPPPGQEEVSPRGISTITAERNGGVWKVRSEAVDYETGC
ncbi:hypothetical protein [Kineococcus sp. SYSU DK003]|uniref:hypothetical protein n=1 Tax=Kineococcus sp. SYSU DK003 TaxID=3383124 RepID=UPI003D7D72E7